MELHANLVPIWIRMKSPRNYFRRLWLSEEAQLRKEWPLFTLVQLCSSLVLFSLVCRSNTRLSGVFIRMQEREKKTKQTKHKSYRNCRMGFRRWFPQFHLRWSNDDVTYPCYTFTQPVLCRYVLILSRQLLHMCVYISSSYARESAELLGCSEKHGK